MELFKKGLGAMSRGFAAFWHLEEKDIAHKEINTKYIKK